MTRLSKLLILMAVLALIAVPMMAQEDDEAGTGGVVIDMNIGDDPASFNPLLGNDSASSDVWQWLYPSIISTNIETGLPEPNQKEGMAAGVEFSEDGTVLTLTLREDLFWNDGTPITANDWKWAVDAVQSNLTTSPRTNAFAQLADGTAGSGAILEVNVVDDYTLEIVLDAGSCSVLGDMNDIAPVPAHIWADLYGEDYASMDEDPRRIPDVTFGPFKDIEFEPGARVSLIADQAYTESELGFVKPSEWVYLSVPDQDVGFERFLAGDITYLAVPSDRQAEIRGNPDFFTYEYSANTVNFIAWNGADPANPVDGIGEDGEAQDQGLHPFFGDPAVRRALNYAVDIDALIDGVLDGNGLRLDTYALPTWPAFASVEPREYSPETALELLAEAGWVDDDGDTSTPLVCQGCLYATEVDPEFEGTSFEFSMKTNAGNTIRERIGEIVQSQFSDIGVAVNYEAIDFSTLVNELLGQTYDAIIIGFSSGEPDGSALGSLFNAGNDVVGSGFNFGSYYNPDLTAALDLADSPTETNNCDLAARGQYIEEAQQILYEDQPAMFLFVVNAMFATQGFVEGPDPTPFAQLWNIDAWDASN